MLTPTEARNFNLSTTFTFDSKTYGITIKESEFQNRRKYKLYLCCTDKKKQVYKARCYGCNAGLDIMIKILTLQNFEDGILNYQQFNNNLWAEFFKLAFIDHALDIDLKFYGILYDAKISITKDDKKVDFYFHKMSKKMLAREAFASTHELNERLSFMEDELRKKIEENNRLKTELEKFSNELAKSRLNTCE